MMTIMHFLPSIIAPVPAPGKPIILENCTFLQEIFGGFALFRT